MAITGNKGEWSEIYALLRLLGDGVMYAGDAYLEKLEDIYYPIVSIIRNESKRYVYSPNKTGDIVLITEEGQEFGRIPMSRFSEKADDLLERIKSVKGEGGSFSSHPTEEFMREIGARKLKAPALDKTDIQIMIHDTQLNLCPLLGFSIKSQLGSPATLINASRATNFIYEICGKDISDADISSINEIEDHLPRIEAIERLGGHLLFRGVCNQTFMNNLLFIDCCLPKIVGLWLLENSIASAKTVKEATENLAAKNPVGYTGNNVVAFYEHKIKELLLAAGLGMVPKEEWNGHYEANGGYIVVKENGEVVCYHFYKRNDVEDYLYYNTRFERSSRTRHDWGTVFRGEDGKVYIKLNLQIRFNK